jgi:hypothetical protein
MVRAGDVVELVTEETVGAVEVVGEMDKKLDERKGEEKENVPAGRIMSVPDVHGAPSPGSARRINNNSGRWKVEGGKPKALSLSKGLKGREELESRIQNQGARR